MSPAPTTKGSSIRQITVQPSRISFRFSLFPNFTELMHCLLAHQFIINILLVIMISSILLHTLIIPVIVVLGHDLPPQSTSTLKPIKSSWPPTRQSSSWDSIPLRIPPDLKEHVEIHRSPSTRSRPRRNIQQIVPGVYSCGHQGSETFINLINPNYPGMDTAIGTCHFRVLLNNPSVCQVLISLKRMYSFAG